MEENLNRTKMTLKRLTQTRTTNSLAISPAVMDKYFMDDKFDDVQWIRIKTRSKGTFEIHISDVATEGRRRQGKIYAPADCWRKVE